MNTEKTIHTQSIFSGQVISLQVDTVELPNGKTASREIVKHPGAVAILAIGEDGRIPVVHQYRAACEELLIEIPAGKLEPGEPLLEAAKRELAEETGYQAAEWRKLISVFTSPGFANEIIHVFVAKGLTVGEQQLDEDEFIQLEHISKQQARQLLAEGRIRDSKTACALYWWLSQDE